MLKLNASYSKKVPAGEEYSSQSFHASVEVELPDGLTQDQLQSRIHETFDLVRNSVEAELHGNVPRTSYGIRSKRNCMEMSIVIVRGIPLQKNEKPCRRATGQRVVRAMFRRVRNSSRICSISPDSVE